MSLAERKYSAFDRELLAMYLSVKHFKHFLEGRKFVIYTDHKPLTFALASSTDRSPRQTRHLSYVAEFTSDVRHVKGSKNMVADALSRPSCSEVRLPTIDFQRMAAAQDPLDARDTSLEVRSVLWQCSLLLCDVSQGHPRPLVPSSFRRQVFEALHQLSHPGPRPCTKLVAARFVWPGMRRDIKSWCRQCPSCQSSKITRHVKAPVVVFPPASRRFGSLHIDLVGPLPPSESYRFLLTIVDCFSRWPEALRLKDISASACVTAFIRHWVFLGSESRMKSPPTEGLSSLVLPGGP